VLAFFELASNLILYILPLCLLPLSLIFPEGTAIFLRLSFIFASFHLLWGFARFVSSEKLFNIAWVVQLPLMAIWFAASWLYLPAFIGSWYGLLLDWSGPALLMVEAVQVVRIFMHITYRLVNGMNNDMQRENLYKGVLLGGSALGYLIFVWCTIRLYSHPSLDAELASFLTAIVCVVLALTIAVTVFVETGSVSDTAALAVFLISVARMAVHYSPSHSNTDRLFETTTDFKNGWNMLNYYASTGTGQMNLNLIFTLDYVVSSVLAVATVLSFPYFDLETEDLSFSSSAFISEEDEALTRGWQRHVFGSIMVVFYSHVILSATGHILPSAHTIRMLQAALAVSYYTWRLYKSVHSDGFKDD